MMIGEWKVSAQRRREVRVTASTSRADYKTVCVREKEEEKQKK